MMFQASSVWQVFDALKVPAIVIFGAGVYFVKFRNVEERLDKLQLEKQDADKAEAARDKLASQIANEREMFSGQIAAIIQRMEALNIQKQDKSDAERMKQDINKVGMKITAFVGVMESRSRNHEMLILAVCNPKEKHSIIAGLKGT